MRLLPKLLICLSLPGISIAQNDSQLFESYDDFKEKSIEILRFKHKDIQPLIERVGTKKGIQITHLGESIQGRSISMISIGNGNTDVLLWSQMHGNEATATMALIDIANFLTADDEFNSTRELLLSQLRIHLIPMLNPDGAELFQRRNALGVDLNRDAVRLQSPEARILKNTRDSLDADFGFNLHDQSTYNNVSGTSKPATLSYLAPPFNYERDINEVRSNAIQIIVHMNRLVQKYAPGQVGRYSDEYEPRAFGDNIQKWGTSTILIESGGHYGDPEKQFIRKLNYVSILSAFYTIADNSFKSLPHEEYEAIPENSRMLFDLKLENVSYELDGKKYTVDVGINRFKVDNSDHTDYNYRGAIVELGDLSTYYGYETIDAQGLYFDQGKVFPKRISYDNALKADPRSYLSDGFLFLYSEDIPKGASFVSNGINLTRQKSITSTLSLGSDANFLLMSGDTIEYVIQNGFVFKPSSEKIKIKNGLVR